jgi:hypothetical protein
MGVTDGSITRSTYENVVSIEGTVTTSSSGTTTITGTVNQGTPAANANAWPIKISNGTSTADLAPSSPSSQGNALLVTTGILNAPVTINALTAVGPGVVVDFGSAKANISAVFTTTAGISAGAVALEVSQDNSNWYRTGTPATLTASAVSNIAISNNAFRYARGAITTTVVGGTVSATIQAA